MKIIIAILLLMLKPIAVLTTTINSSLRTKKYNKVRIAVQLSSYNTKNFVLVENISLILIVKIAFLLPYLFEI